MASVPDLEKYRETQLAALQPSLAPLGKRGTTRAFIVWDDIGDKVPNEDKENVKALHMVYSKTGYFSIVYIWEYKNTLYVFAPPHLYADIKKQGVIDGISTADLQSPGHAGIIADPCDDYLHPRARFQYFYYVADASTLPIIVRTCLGSWTSPIMGFQLMVHLMVYSHMDASPELAQDLLHLIAQTYLIINSNEEMFYHHFSIPHPRVICSSDKSTALLVSSLLGCDQLCTNKTEFTAFVQRTLLKFLALSGKVPKSMDINLPAIFIKTKNHWDCFGLKIKLAVLHYYLLGKRLDGSPVGVIPPVSAMLSQQALQLLAHSGMAAFVFARNNVDHFLKSSLFNYAPFVRELKGGFQTAITYYHSLGPDKQKFAVLLQLPGYTVLQESNYPILAYAGPALEKDPSASGRGLSAEAKRRVDDAVVQIRLKRLETLSQKKN